MADTNTVHVGMPGGQPPNVDVRLVTVERDVIALKSDIGEIKSAMVAGFEKLGAQMASRNQPNWHAIGLAVVVLVPFLGWSWSQLTNIQTHLEQVSSTFVSRADIMDKFKAEREVADINAAHAKEMRDTLAASANQVADLKAQINNAKIERIVGELGDMRATIDENRKAIAEITAPRDTISRILKRLDDIDDRSRAPPR